MKLRTSVNGENCGEGLKLFTCIHTVVFSVTQFIPIVSSSEKVLFTVCYIFHLDIIKNCK